jgi:hypothetical protein
MTETKTYSVCPGKKNLQCSKGDEDPTDVYQREGDLQWISKRWKLTMYLKEMETYYVFKIDGNCQTDNDFKSL